jgi:zinc transport system permease protein
MVPDMDDFLVRAVLAGLGVAAVAAPLGVFVVWRRMAYFGDTMAHSALLGITLGVLLGVNLDFGVFVVCVATALLLVGLQRRRQLADDTLLGILSHGTLSLGVIAVTFLDSLRLDLISYLFGDILAVSTTDLAWIYGGGALVLIVLAVIWRPLLASVVHEELARVEGVPVTAVRLVFMILMAAVIAAAMKVVGVLLITALLIIPPATARRLACTPEQMAVMAAVAGCAAVGLGLWGSVVYDAPSGPAIVVAALVLFAASLAVPVLSITPRR